MLPAGEHLAHYRLIERGKMTLDASILPVVIGSAARAATMLVEESRRPAGPRGAGD